MLRDRQSEGEKRETGREKGQLDREKEREGGGRDPEREKGEGEGEIESAWEG